MALVCWTKFKSTTEGNPGNSTTVVPGNHQDTTWYQTTTAGTRGTVLSAAKKGKALREPVVY